jgi:hypothetical protein
MNFIYLYENRTMKPFSCLIAWLGIPLVYLKKEERVDTMSSS